MEEDQVAITAPTVRNTWILLVIIWIICLIPVPGTSYIAIVLNIGALIMTVVSLVKGETRQGLLQLLSIFIVTPLFDVIGMMIFLTFVSHAINVHNVTPKSLSTAVIKNYEMEINKYNTLAYKDYLAGKQAVYKGKEKVLDSITHKNKEKAQEKAVVSSKYVLYLKNGGKLDGTSVTRHNNLLKIKSASGVVINIDEAMVARMEKIETRNNKTTVSPWKPGDS